METAAQAARNILTGLHEVMASGNHAQAKLNHVVNIIGEALTSEVCSIYLLRDGVLELFATRGLNQSAVHVTKLAFGEGLVGTIAENVETLNLDEAAAHPAFRYMQETGEERFHSFAGVPIVRSEQAVGVLAVQHAEPRRYAEVEIEALQTTAMVLAELIANAGLIDEHQTAGSAQTGTVILNGLPLVTGMAAGVAIFHQPHVRIAHTVAEDIEAERARVYSAFDRMREQIDRMASQAEFGSGGEHDEIIATYKMFAYDEGWSRRINEAIDSGLTAEAAIERVQQRTRMRMRQIDDPLLADRMHDLEDLSNRLLRIVSGQMSTAAQLGLKQDSILVARNLGPAELLEYDKRRLRGVILEEGSLTAHVTIVARAMGVPVLGRVGGVRQSIVEGDMLLLNVDEKSVIVRPGDAAKDAFSASLTERQKKRARYAALRDEPAVTRDGKQVTLMINAGLRDDVSALDVTGADGIGLFRTELQFMIAERMPTPTEQITLYKTVLEAVGDKQVTFRTLDIGGDKILPYMRVREEENPALGWRAIRIGLDRPGLLRAQLRALLKAAAGRHLKIMFPMVASVDEFVRAKALVQREQGHLVRYHHAVPESVKLGVMVEVPSLLFEIDEIAAEADFLSVGSNDLMQFLYAADRENPLISNRFDPLGPASLRALRLIAEAGKKAGIPVTLCGELGGKPLEAMTLIAIGYQSLSMSPAAIGPVKAMLLDLDIRAAREKILDLLDHARGISTLRPAIEAFARDHGIPI